jgi:undecaprenyl-phosphate 4-deoxy-4-formamido-L-arabinose transferase
MVLFGLGLVGEYVGRIYQQVRGRPRYLIQALLESGEARGERREVGPPGGSVTHHNSLTTPHSK